MSPSEIKLLNYFYCHLSCRTFTFLHMLVSLSEQVTLLKIIFWKYIMTIQTSSKVCSIFNSFINFFIIQFSVFNVANNALYAFGNFKASGVLLLMLTCFVLCLARKSNVQRVDILLFYKADRLFCSFFMTFGQVYKADYRLDVRKCVIIFSERRDCILRVHQLQPGRASWLKTKLHCECTHFKRPSERFSERIKFIYAQW